MTTAFPQRRSPEPFYPRQSTIGTPRPVSPGGPREWSLEAIPTRCCVPSAANLMRALRIAIAGIACIGAAGPVLAGYVQTNLVSDLPGVAALTDPNLQNPWGMSSSPTSPIWVSDNRTGLATLYNGAGAIQSLVVTIPPPTGGTPPAAPTGQVFNGSATDFKLPNGNPARFIFATEDGTISGWNGGTSAVLVVDNSVSGAVYKGLAIGSSGGSNFLFATNFNAGTIDVFDAAFNSVNTGGKFTDPNLPAGYAPFNIQNINGTLYVTYALQDAAKHDDVSGPGNGFVDAFDTAGNLIKRVSSGGALDSPWGLALGSAGFGQFAGDLLVGNFGDGRISAFDPISDAFLGQLQDQSASPITIDGLWGLRFGNGGSGGDVNALFFTAGIPGPDNVEDHGLFGTVTVPEPATLALLGIGLASLAFGRRRKLH